MKLTEDGYANMGWIANRIAELQAEQEELSMISRMLQMTETPEPKDQFGRPIPTEQITQLKVDLKVRLVKAKSNKTKSK